MKRRTFLKAGATAFMILPSGCAILGLARFVGRAAVVRSGARATRANKRGAMSSFGRGSALSIYRSYRVLRAVNAIKNIESIHEESELITLENSQRVVDIRSDDRSCIISRHGLPILESKLSDDKYIEHQSFLYDDHVGASKFDGDTIRHFDSEGDPDGFDAFDESAGVCRHFDKNNDLQGISKTGIEIIDGRKCGVLTDDSYLMEQFKKEQQQIDPATRSRMKAMEDIANLNSKCSALPINHDCTAMAVKVASILKEIEKIK